MDSSKQSVHRSPFLTFALSLILFVVVVYVAIVVLQIRHDEVSSPAGQVVSPSSTPTPTYPQIEAYYTPVVAPPVAPEEQWQVYTSNALGISLRRPPDWYFTEFRHPDGHLEVVWSTPIKNPNPQNWREGQLAGGGITTGKAANTETFFSFLNRLEFERQQGKGAPLGTRLPSTLKVGNKQGVVFELLESKNSLTVFVDKGGGFICAFTLYMTPQSAKTNYEIYRAIFEKVLSSITFF